MYLKLNRQSTIIINLKQTCTYLHFTEISARFYLQHLSTLLFLYFYETKAKNYHYNKSKHFRLNFQPFYLLYARKATKQRFILLFGIYLASASYFVRGTNLQTYLHTTSKQELSTFLLSMIDRLHLVRHTIPTFMII